MRTIELDEHQIFGTNVPKWTEGKKTWSLGSSGAPHINLEKILDDPISLKTSLNWSGEWYGPRAVREGVIECMKYDGLPLDGIRTVNGSNEGIFNVIMTLLKPGDEVIVEMPAWYQYYAVARYFAGAKVKVVFANEENQWKPNFDEINNLITPKTRLICLNNPCNPTGRIIDANELKAIIEIASEKNIWILQDEVYRGTEWNGKLSPSIVNHYEKGVTIASITKTLGVTGLRMGWIACRDMEFMKKIHATTLYVGLCTNRLGEIVAAKALEPELYSKLVIEGKELGARNLEILKNWMARQEELHWVEPKAAYCCFPSFDNEMTTWDFCKRALIEQHVGVVPGSGFMVEGHIRLGFGIHTERFQEGIRRLGLFLQSLRK